LFGGLALSYDKVLDWTTLLQDMYWKRWAVAKASPSQADIVLDIGCGTCVTEERLMVKGCRMVGLDMTEEMLRLGARKGLGVALFNGDAEALPFADASFDVVISFYVVKYCRIERFISEIARVLKPGGRIVIYDFVRPRGSASPILAFYIYGVLRIAGRLLRHVDPGVSYTFERLPGIVRATMWNEDLPPVLERFHLAVAEQATLSGGTVEALLVKRAA